MPSDLDRLDAVLLQRNLTLAVAESLTCGQLALTLGGAEGAGDWLRGGVVAYADEVKFDVLDVPEGPVITAEAASGMAVGAASRLGARLGVAVTGVGGPGPAEGKPAGTVYLATAFDGEVVVTEQHFPGPPEQVMSATVDAAIALALEAVTRS